MPKPKKTKTLTRTILEKLSEIGEATIDVLLPSGRGKAGPRQEVTGRGASYQFSPRTFSAILSRLRRQGLVVKQGGNRQVRWSLTKKGRKLLDESDEVEFLAPVDGVPRLVIFDVPEAERRKRNVIRRELVSYEFEQLQKSVWLGHRPLPEDFIELLDALDMKKHVHILSIQKEGTVADI